MSDSAQVDLEARLAFQEDAIDGLNRTIARQDAELVALRRDLEDLRRQLRAMAPSPAGHAADEPPPPHY